MTLPRLSESYNSESAREPDLVALLDREIEHARAQQSREGWTNWALLLAIATLVWAASSEWERVPVLSTDAAIWFILVSLIAESFVSFIAGQNVGHTSARRLRLGSFNGLRSPALVTLAVRGMVIIGVAIAFRRSMSLFAFVAVLSWYTLSVAVLGFLAVMIAKGFPTVSSENPPRPIMRWGMIAIGVLAIFGAIVSVDLPESGQAVASIRFGSLLALALYLVVLSVVERHREPLLESFVELRRSIGLGEIDQRGAAKQFTILVRGLALSDWIQEDVRTLTTEYQRLLSHQRAVNELASLCNSDMDRLTGGEDQDPKGTSEKIRERMVAVDSLVQQAKASFNAILRLSPEIAGKMGYAAGATNGKTEEDSEAAALKRAVDGMVSDAINRWVSLEQQWPRYKAAIDQHLASLRL
jgi:hypothetical protein